MAQLKYFSLKHIFKIITKNKHKVDVLSIHVNTRKLKKNDHASHIHVALNKHLSCPTYGRVLTKGLITSELGTCVLYLKK